MNMNMGATLRNLFGGGNPNSAGPPNNPNASPTNQRQVDQAAAGVTRGATPGGENTQLENSNAGAEKLNADGTPATPANPMDKFKDIWQAPKGADGKPITPAGREKLMNVDPAKIFEFAGKQDYRKFVKPETYAAIAKGGDEGSAAFAQAIQDIGSASFASSVTASATMMEKALERAHSQWEAGLPEMFKKMSLRENLSNKNPVVNHPAAKPIIEALQSVLARNHPDATAQDLQETAEEFLSTFAESLKGKPAASEDGSSVGGGKKETDWSAFA
jgi:hypothetical protein